jgi:hypothetical protein
MSKIKRFFRYLKYWIKDTYKPYNVVRIKTLSKHYVDRDVILEHAMFQIVADFLEQEIDSAAHEWQHEETVETIAKCRELVDWWRNVYLKFDAYAGYDKSKATPDGQRLDSKGFWQVNGYEAEFYSTAARKTKEMRATLTEKLIELVKIRNNLWT